MSNYTSRARRARAWLNSLICNCNGSDSRRRRLLPLPVAAAEVLENRLLLSAVSVDSQGVLRFDAEAQENNFITVTNLPGGGVTIVDKGAPSRVGSGCIGGGLPGVPIICNATITGMEIRVGDYSDRVDLSGMTSPVGLVRVYGGDGHEVLIGSPFNDVLLGEDGNDRIEGGAGNDFMSGGSGNDIYTFHTTTSGFFELDRVVEDAAAGIDTLDFKFVDESQPVFVDLTDNSPVDARHGSREIELANGTHIENVIGGAGDDEIIGNDLVNRLEGRSGNDHIIGVGGNDSILGGIGADCLFGNDGDDTIKGGIHDDVIDGGSGVDMIFGQSGNDWLAGGPGFDTIDGGEGDNSILQDGGFVTCGAANGDGVIVAPPIVVGLPGPVVIGPPNTPIGQALIGEWTTVPGAIAFEVWIYDVNAGRQVFQRTDIPDTDTVLDGVVEVGDYQMFARAIDGIGGLGDWSKPYLFDIHFDDPMPSSPTLIGPAGPSSNTTPTFQWTTSPAASDHEIVVYDVDRGVEVWRATNIVGTSYTLPQQFAPGRFQWFVRAFNSVGENGNWSTPLEFELVDGEIIPEVPAFTSPEGTNQNAIPLFEWTSSTGATGYEIVIYDSVRGIEVWRDRNIAGTSYTAPFEFSDGYYQAFVRAFNSAGETNGWSSAHEFQVQQTNETTDTTPTIRWEPVEGADRYEFYLYDNGVLLEHDFVTDNSFTPLNPLPYSAPGTVYTMFARGLSNSGVVGAWSPALVFRIVR